MVEAKKKLKPEELHFDYQNPRLVEYGMSGKESEKEIIDILWDAMDVRELVMSISASCFFNYESLVVVEEGHRYVVIEGNRRLAAVKILLNSDFRQEG